MDVDIHPHPTSSNFIHPHPSTSKFFTSLPSPLLNILPSPEIKLCEKIMMVWFGDRSPTTNDLKPYLEVQKEVVLRALQWLRLYNKLYCQITVN